MRGGCREQGGSVQELKSGLCLRSRGLPRWLSVKNPPANAGDLGSILGLGRSPRE